MLTKDLLINRKVANKIMPRQLDASEQQYLNLASDLIAAVQSSCGKSLTDLEEALAAVTARQEKIKAGFVKLLIDQCVMEDVSDEAEIWRWQAMAAAQQVRLQEKWQNLAEYQAAVSQLLGRDFRQIQHDLYADLPDFRKIIEVPQVDAEWLIHRYNCAQIQGLILHAQRLMISIKGVDLGQRRALFRALKFHRLLIDHVIEEDDNLTFALSGPMSLFDASQMYGLKMANFFPYLLGLPKFQLDGEIKLEGKNYLLAVNEKLKIRSHYGVVGSYVPDELTLCIDAFNEKYAPFHAAPADEFLNLGRQSYCFPDMVIKTTGKGKGRGRSIYVELFHRWHAGQLQGRLDALAASTVKGLRIGVCRSIAKKPEIKALLAQSSWYQDHGFEFTDFPSPRQLVEALD